MSINWEKIGKTAIRGAAGYMEGQARSCSRSKNFSHEQREDFSNFADRMSDIRDRFTDYDYDDNDNEY